MATKRLVILDAYSLLFRAFFATRYLSTSDGRPTNALYGFVGMMFYVLEKDRPDAIVVAFDAPGKTFRHAAFDEYKGTRRETAEELKSQLGIARDLITSLGIPQFEVTGYEADDVVGTISRLAEKNGYHTSIVTGDLDALQLVDDCVSVVTTKQGVSEVVKYGPAEVFARYGFEPKFVPDYKAIVGDTSDNIPGVPGIGQKGASELIQAFGTIESILEKWDDVPEKYRKKIETVKEQMIQSKWLATINCEAPIDYNFIPFKLSEDQMEAARAFFDLYELRSHAKRMDMVLGPYRVGFTRDAVVRVQVESEHLEITQKPAGNFDQLREWVGDNAFAMLVESGPTQPGMFDEEMEQQAYVAIGTEVRKTTEKDGLELFKRLPWQAVLHDAKPLFKKLPACMECIRFDTMLAGYVLQSGRSTYVLRDLVQGYLDITPPTAIPEMTAALGLLEPAMRDRLAKEGQTQVLEEIELPLVPLLAEVENTGIEVDPNSLIDFSKSLEGTIEETQRRIWATAEQEFNIGSPKQLGDILFEKLMLPGPKKGKTGYATGAEVLQLLAPTHPICSDVLTWRELSKLKSTYADALGKLIAPDGRIHTTYSQTVAATGRLSSNDPNLQNIPIRTEIGRNIRKAFVAGKGYKLASFDYSQIELRVLAHLSKDEGLVEAFRTYEDVHTVTAALMYGMRNEDVSKEQRRYSKMLNYAVSYGVTDFGLAQQLGGGFSVSEARALIEQYFSRFTKIKAYMDAVVAEARSKGYTTTLYGRRRYFGDIHAANRAERMGAERQAMNAPIQGAAADMMKLAMLKVRKRLDGAASRMLLSVHDEILIELAEGEDYLIEEIRADMSNALPLDVPVEVDAKVGQNWDEMTVLPAPAHATI